MATDSTIVNVLVLVSRVVTEAEPTEFMLAAFTFHMHASAILLNQISTLLIGARFTQKELRNVVQIL